MSAPIMPEPPYSDGTTDAPPPPIPPPPSGPPPSGSTPTLSGPGGSGPASTGGAKRALFIVAMLIFLGGIAGSVFGAMRTASTQSTDTGIADEFTIPANETSVDLVTVGDCMNEPAAATFGSVEIVPCDEEHDLEIFSILELNDVATYPTDEEFDQLGFTRCLSDFTLYTGEAYEDSDLWVSYFVPDASSWKRGDRTVQCYLYLPGERIVGSRAAS